MQGCAIVVTVGVRLPRYDDRVLCILEAWPNVVALVNLKDYNYRQPLLPLLENISNCKLHHQLYGKYSGQ